MAKPHYLDKAGQPLPDDAPPEQIAESVYDVHQKGILYAPAPGLREERQGRIPYHHLTREQGGRQALALGLRANRARASWWPRTTSTPSSATPPRASRRRSTPSSSEYVLGLKEYGELIKAEDAKLLKGLPESSPDKPFLDFRRGRWPASRADKYTVRASHQGQVSAVEILDGDDLQSPVPWEADAFYAQPGMNANGLSLVKWPVGTGPFMMTEYVQDRRHVMKRNPTTAASPIPCEGEPGDKEKGLLDDCGKTMPFVDTIVSTIVEEAVPRKEMFKQGYLDVPEIERPDWGVSSAPTWRIPTTCGAFYEARGLPAFPQTTDINNWYLGLQLARSGGGQGRHARAAGEEPQAAPGARSRSTGRRATAASSATRAAWRRTARCRRACSARARARPRASTR